MFDVVCPWVVFVLFLLSLVCLSYSNLSIMVRKTTTRRLSSFSSTPSFNSERFLSEKNQETYEKLNLLQSVWVRERLF